MAIRKYNYDFYTFELKGESIFSRPPMENGSTAAVMAQLREVLVKGFEFQDAESGMKFYTERGVERDNILLMPLRCSKKVARYSGEVNVVQKNGNGDTVTMQPDFEESHPYCFVIFDLRSDVPIVAIQRNVFFGVYPDKVTKILTRALSKAISKSNFFVVFDEMKIDRDFWDEVSDRMSDGDKLKEMVFDFEDASIDKRALDSMTEEVRGLVTAMKQFGQKRLVMRYTTKNQQDLLKREKDFLSMLNLCYLCDNEYQLVASFTKSSVYRTGEKARLRLVLSDEVRDEFMNNITFFDDKYRLALWLDKARMVCCVKDLQMIRFSDEDCRRVREAYGDSHLLEMMRELTSQYAIDLETIKPQPEEFFILVFALFDRIRRNENIDDRYGIRIWGMLRDAIASATKRACGRDADKAERETMAGIVYATVMDCILLADITKYHEQHNLLWSNFCEYQKYIDITYINIYQGNLEKFFKNNTPLKFRVIDELRHYLSDPTTFYTREDGMPMRVEVRGDYQCPTDLNNPLLPYIHQKRDPQTAIAYIKEALKGSADPEKHQVMNTPLAKVVARMIDEEYLRDRVPFKVLKTQFPDLIGGNEKTYDKFFKTHFVKL